MRLNKNITERLNLLKEAVGFLPDEKNFTYLLKNSKYIYKRM